VAAIRFYETDPVTPHCGSAALANRADRNVPEFAGPCRRRGLARQRRDSGDAAIRDSPPVRQIAAFGDAGRRCTKLERLSRQPSRRR